MEIHKTRLMYDSIDKHSKEKNKCQRKQKSQMIRNRNKAVQRGNTSKGLNTLLKLAE